MKASALSSTKNQKKLNKSQMKLKKCTHVSFADAGGLSSALAGGAVFFLVLRQSLTRQLKPLSGKTVTIGQFLNAFTAHRPKARV